jgi:hypothetical protein
VPTVDGVSNLHAVWDSLIYEQPGYPNLPLNTADWSWYTSTAAAMYSEYPVDSNTILPNDFMAWATQSYNLAVQYAYPGFVTGQIPSQQYQDTAVPVLKQNMMLGAARLANLIEYIYG